MTHKDIYTKFMIEYDKANVTSSYPSLTEYEVATLLDKAYLALIAQKLTGNNQRRMPFEGDNKAIADIEPLIAHADPTLFDNKHAPAINITQFKLPSDYLYFLQTFLNYKINRNGDRLEESEVYNPTEGEYENQDPDIWVQHTDVYYGQNPFGSSDGSTTSTNTAKSGQPYDSMITRLLPAKLVTHEIAEKFMCTPYNMPWVKNPVCYIEDGVVYAVYDPINKPVVEAGATAHLTYIKKPKSFVLSLVTTTSEDPSNPDPVNPDPVNPDPVNPTTSGQFILDESELDGNDKLGNNSEQPTGENTGNQNQNHQQNPNDDTNNQNQGGQNQQEDPMNNEEQVVTKTYTFTFNNPEQLIPATTRSAEEGGSVSVQNTTFTSSDGGITIQFSNENVQPRSDARIVTNNAANNKVPYLTFERGEKLIVAATGGVLKYIKIPAWQIIGGLTLDGTSPTQNVGTFNISEDRQYNQWVNEDEAKSVSSVVLVNSSPVGPMIETIEVCYTTTEEANQEQENNNPPTTDYSSEYGLSDIDGMTADFLNYDENRLERSVYLSEKISNGQVQNASEFNNLFAFFVDRGTPIYTSDKKVELRGYYNNDTVATGKFVQATMTSDEYGSSAPTSAIRVQFDAPIQDGSLSSRRYVLCVYRGTFGDSKFSQYMQNPSGYLQSGKSKQDCHTNEHLYYFVDLV